MLVFPAGVSTLVGLTIHDYVGEDVLSALTHPRIPSGILTLQQLSRTSVRSQAVTPPAFLLSLLVTGQPPVFPNFALHSINTYAGLRPSSLRVSCKTPHLPSVLTAITRRAVRSCDVEGVCLVERSVGRSSHVDHDGIFQQLALATFHSDQLLPQARDSAVYFFV